MSEKKYHAPSDDVDYHHRMAERHGGKRELHYMHPDDYHKEVAKLHGGRDNRPHDGPVEKIKNQIHKEGLRHIPWIHYNHKGEIQAQEGRHRVAALHKLGYTRVPVMHIHDAETNEERKHMNRLVQQFFETYVPFPEDGKTLKHYEIYHRSSGRVVGKAKTRSGASRSIDTHDNKHGSYAHGARCVYEDAVPTNAVGGGAIAGTTGDPPGGSTKKMIRRLKAPSQVAED